MKCNISVTSLKFRFFVALLWMLGVQMWARTLMQSSDTADIEEVRSTMCTADGDLKQGEKILESSTTQQFPFSLIGKLSFKDPTKDNRIRICSALVLTTRAIFTSADCLFQRPYEHPDFGKFLGGVRDNLTFEIDDNDNGQSSTFEISDEIFIPDDFNNSDLFKAANFGVAILQSELSTEILKKGTYRMTLMDDECRKGQVLDVVGYEHQGKELYWIHACQQTEDGCQNACKVEYANFDPTSAQDFKGAPVLDCLGENQYTLRGVQGILDDQLTFVSLDTKKITTIINWLNQNDSIYNSNNTLFIEREPIITVPQTRNTTSTEIWPIILAIVLTVLVIVLLECLVWLWVRRRYRNYTLVGDVKDIEDELEDNVDLKINLKRDIVKQKPLGNGGFGMVYKGVWRPKPREVAFKTLKKRDVLLQEDSLEGDSQIKQELLFLCKMRHSNILHCYGGCLQPDVAMVMEYCKGGDLYNYIYNIRKEKLTLSECYSVGLDVASGLAYLHQNNIIHRDIKSKNILRQSKGSEKLGVVKIGDFGLARLVPDEQSQMETQQNMGTFVYMAPELQWGANNSIRVSRKVDIYSLGMVLFECATGSKPWDGVPQNTIPARVGGGDRPQIPEDVDPHLADVIKQCWHENPKERPESDRLVSEFKLQLTHCGSSRGKNLADLNFRIQKCGSDTTIVGDSDKSLSPISENGKGSSPEAGSSETLTPFANGYLYADYSTEDNTANME